MRHDYTKQEIAVNEYILQDLINNISLAQHIKNVLDSKAFFKPQYAIDSIMDPDDRNSLMCYLIRTEQFEACGFLKTQYENMIIGPDKQYYQE